MRPFGSVSGLSACFNGDDLVGVIPLNFFIDSVLEGELIPLLGTRIENPKGYQAMNLYPKMTALLDQRAPLPPIYFHCGSEDFLLEQSRQMNYLLKSRGASFEYLESPGAHNWKFWKQACVGVLEFHWKYFHPEKTP